MNCKNCGKEFKAKITASRRPKYCSSKCFGLSYRRPVEGRFWKKVHKTDGCWEWLGCTNEWGYGRFYSNKKRPYVHKFSFELHHGPLPAGKLVLHHCDNPKCVRPDHLYAGTPKENIDDCIRRGRFRPYGYTMRKDRA